jgi:hypothetical protein
MTEENVDMQADETQDPAETPSVEATEEAAITGELRRMGERLASAIRAATGTPEAEALRGEVGDGLRKLRTELDGVLRRGKESSLAPEPDAAAEPATDTSPDEAAEPEADRGAAAPRAARVQLTVRNEIANALRSLNGALDRLAGSIAAGDEEASDENVT